MAVRSQGAVDKSEFQEELKKRNRQDYASVKEDFRCRACVALSGEFFKRVLPSAEARYRRYIEDGDDAQSRYRERMTSEVHEAVDALCERVRDEHQRIHDERRLGGSTKDVREGIDIACASTLEDLNEVLTDVAFRYLTPKRLRHAEGSAPHAATGKGKGRAEEDAASLYTLPYAGAFCEAQELCSAYRHYHITSEEDVEERLRRGRAAAAEAREKKAQDDATASSSSATGEKRKREEKEEMTKEYRERMDAELRKSRRTAASRTEEDEDPSPWELLTDPETWVRIRDQIPWQELRSVTYWKRFASFLFTNSAVHFHLLPTLRMGMYVVLIPLAVLVAVVVCCCAGGDKASVTPAKKQD